MRFWGKTKQGEKKPSREKLICGADSMDGDYGDTGPLLGEGERGEIDQRTTGYYRNESSTFQPYAKHV